MGFWDTATNFGHMVKSIQDDFREDVIEAGKDLLKDTNELGREVIADAVEKVNYEAADRLRRHYKKKDHTLKKVKNTVDTVKNVGGKTPGEKIRGWEDLDQGDHICIDGLLDLYSHHAIYIGKQKVIHYVDNFDGSVEVRKDTIKALRDGAAIYRLRRKDSPARYDDNEIVKRAKSRLGEQKYHLLYNNCENFARWCRNGRDDESF